MPTNIIHPDSVVSYAVDLGQLIGTYRWHGWTVPDEVIYAWEQVLDGTYFEEIGFTELYDEAVEEAMQARHEAYHRHNDKDCEWHRAMRATETEILWDLGTV
jgi:hypothetical protein